MEEGKKGREARKWIDREDDDAAVSALGLLLPLEKAAILKTDKKIHIIRMTRHDPSLDI